ncbi:hypothetical protein N752_25505 [Desulforamulus aquiferis]|nr:hypothetical protein N752_25505 [Desulforamulus aquiferis]
MAKFFLNGKQVIAREGMNLLEYLREEARLTSVKNGCAEGACGACMILVDGQAKRACALTVDRVSGKSLVTVEGLSERERQIYSWAFAEAGAVQCGFCTPGMVISAKGLLDLEAKPSPAQIRNALKFNICRCTGYVKIEQAVLLAAKALGEKLLLPPGKRPGLEHAIAELMQRKRFWGQVFMLMI